MQWQSTTRKTSYSEHRRRFNVIEKKIRSLGLLCVLAALVVSAPAGQKPPQDSGIAGLQQLFRKLKTTARLMHTTAHPDDEDGGMLALESRGKGVSVALMTLNRGEGGQNKTGSELSDALGVLRTLELLAADSYYGVEQRFSRVADFGFSKNSEETIRKWKGKETALEDMVRVIRTFRPDVVAARFQGAARDGHGHHQAAGALTPDAFKAAGDPNQFPEQIKEGLQPWQPLKLYSNNIRQNEAYNVRLDTGAYDPVLGMSYVQFSLDGLSHQLSQGSGGARVPPGHRYSQYRLLDSKITTVTAGQREENFFDGIDTTLPGLAARLGSEEVKAPFLRPALAQIERNVNDAITAFTPDDPSRSAKPLLEALQSIGRLLDQIKTAELSPVSKANLLIHLRTKQNQFEKAANLALGVVIEAVVEARADESGEPVSIPSSQQTFLVATPGQTFTLAARLFNRSKEPITPSEILLETPPDWKITPLTHELKALNKDDSVEVRFRVTVPENAAITRPYWRREDPQIESLVTIAVPEYQTLALPPAPVRALAKYRAFDKEGRVESVAQVKYADPLYGQKYRDLVVAPPFSVELQPSTRVMSTKLGSTGEIIVAVRNNITGGAKGSLRLELPSEWRSEPVAQDISFTRDGELNSYRFKLIPGSLNEGRYEARAVVEYGGKKYSEGYTVVTRNDLDTFYFYKPAIQRLRVVAVTPPSRLKVGYLVGAGDEIPAVLGQIGIATELITPGDLATGNLSRFDTIIVGIRAYDVRVDVRDNNKRLLDFVERGGTLVVQYNQSAAAFNAGKYTPYPASASGERVTVEEAPVEILDPQDSVFRFPNRISANDFDGWVQERGVYFMNKWDNRYRPLLASNDPGEKPLQGGMLRATYGKGTYIYTGYAFFRQLPAGVPGAVRLFVNLLSAGHERGSAGVKSPARKSIRE